MAVGRVGFGELQPLAQKSKRRWCFGVVKFPLGVILFGLGLYIGIYLDAVTAPVNKIPKPLVVQLPNYTDNHAQASINPVIQSSLVDPTIKSVAVSYDNPTDRIKSFFYIKNSKASYNICDILELTIEARDKAKVRKTHGGDVLWPYIFNGPLKASGPADEVIDHGNGSYTARFTLTWAGEVEPRVRFMYTAEYAAVLWSIRQRFPIRLGYDGKFIANGTTEITPCHISKVMPFIGSSNQVPLSYSSENKTCDFSDAKAGTSWYCLKPKTLPCSAYAQHVIDKKRGAAFLKKVLLQKEVALIPKGASMMINNGSMKTIRVVSSVAGQSTDTCLQLPECTMGLPPKRTGYSAGFYYNDIWQSKVCKEKIFNLKDTLQCLRGKSLYFYGDSTVRQWFEYLLMFLRPTMKEVNIKGGGASKIGPRYGEDLTNNITMFFRLHEFPIRSGWSDIHHIKFIVNEVDALVGGPDTIVAFTYWAHFTSTNLTYFKSRLTHIKEAIKRLHKRGSSPSPVIFKSANTRGVLGVECSDLYAYDLDQTMRALYTGMPDVTIIDAWDMTLCHRTGYRIHPLPVIIKEEIKMFLNAICKAQ